MCCRSDFSSDVVWVNQAGTFGISSAPYWWAKLVALIGRFVGYLFLDRWMMQMIYVDDLHGTFSSEFVGFCMRSSRRSYFFEEG